MRILTSPHLTSPHLTSPHLTSPHLTSPHLTSLLLSSLICGGVGCSRETPVASKAPESTSHQSSQQAFDWGKVIGDSSQKLFHDYQVVNTAATVRKIQEVNTKPCCGRVEWVGSRNLAPGESGILRVELKVSGRVGVVQHNAVIAASGPRQAEMRFTTVAEVLPRISIAEETGALAVVASGEVRRRIVEVISYGASANDGFDLGHAELRSELPTSWVNEATKRPLTATIFEQKRSFAVELKNGSYEGSRNASVGIMDRGELAYHHTMTWEDRLAIKATPATLMINATQQDAVVMVRAQEDLKFRVLKVTADLEGVVADPSPDNSQPNQNHRLKIRATKSSPQIQIGRLRIETDHPTQPIVNVAIMQQP